MRKCDVHLWPIDRYVSFSSGYIIFQAFIVYDMRIAEPNLDLDSSNYYQYYSEQHII